MILRKEFTPLIIKQQINDALGDLVELTTKPVPRSIFDIKTAQNKDYDFAISYQTPDYQTDAWTFLRLLAAPPNPNIDVTSTLNVTGKWSYEEGFDWIAQNEPSRLSLFNGWDGASGTPQEFKTILHKIAVDPNFSTYGSYLSTILGWSTAKKMSFYTKLEILIRDQAPVIPLYHAASLWFARRILGATAIPNFPTQYKYAYNANNVPRTKYSLPGMEAFSKDD